MQPTHRTAFVLGGGGVLGAVEAGMLRALLETGVRPDLVLGTSVGALNGALLAMDPRPEVVERLIGLWRSAGDSELYADKPVRQVRRASAPAPISTAAGHCASGCRRSSTTSSSTTSPSLPVLCGKHRACRRALVQPADAWWTRCWPRPLSPACSRPTGSATSTILDGGIVNSIPVGRAVDLGATLVFVLQVGRVDRPLSVPRRPWEVARVSFEIARRHRFHREMNEVPTDVEVHVLPTGGGSAKDDALRGYRDFSRVERRIDAAYDATRGYLRERL